jgi:glycosyltransferase involved in cell wall biosynthesis
MIDILVVSHACVTAVNRIPYRRLRDMGWNIEIVTATRAPSKDLTREADPPAPDDPPMHFLPVTGSNMRLWRFIGLGRLVAQRQPRIVMLDYDPGTLITLLAGWQTRGSGARIACLSYDNIVRSIRAEFRHSLGAGLRAMMVRAMSALARSVVDHVFVLSRDSADVMAVLGFRGRTSRIPLGFDPALFHPDPAARARVRAELGLTAVTFAYFGRVVPEKGAHLLIGALHRIRERPWQLLMDRFSDYKHPYIRELNEQIDRLSLRDRVVYFDASHDEIGDYMNAADVVVMPSISNARWKEQYGRVAAESMACGRTVVVSSSGALPELVGDAGIVVPEADLVNLDRHLARVLEDSRLREETGSRASRRALAELSIPVQCERMHERFIDWAKPSGTPRGQRLATSSS